MELSSKIVSAGKTLIIAEAGVNHNGDIEMALKLCDAARSAGADMVKFQTWKTEELMVKDAPKAEYQQQLDEHISQFEMAKSLELPFEGFVKIKEHCENIGIGFLSTPDEEVSLNFLVNKLGLNLIKIGSGEICNVPFLIKVGRTKKDVILSTGMSTIEKVAAAYDILQTHGSGDITLLHCTSNYPAPYHEVNLKVIDTLRSRFNVRVGYSDHTEGIEVAIAAVAIGAEVIEKHFTLDRSLPGPDHKASIEPADFKKMVISIRNIEKAIGDGIKRVQPSEYDIRRVVSKSIVAKTSIMKGETFSENNIGVKRAGKGISSSEWFSVIGKTASRNFKQDELIEL